MAQQRGRPRKNVNVENAQDVDFTEESIVGDEVMGEDFEPQVKDTKVKSDSGSVGEGTYGDYNPFAESVVERDYATPKTASGLVDDLEEPSFVPPSYEDIISDRQEAEATGANDEETLMQKQAQGKIDLSMQVPVTETGDTMSVAEFVAQYNEQSANALQYDKDFGYKVRPAMIRVFMKRGWGMTDEQFLMYMFGKDIAIKVGIMFQLRKTINGTLDTLEKMYKRENPNAGRGGQTQVYEQTTQGSIIEDDYEDDYEDEEEQVVQEPQDQFTSSMNINMPQNPVDPMQGHPKEVKNVLRNNK